MLMSERPSRVSMIFFSLDVVRVVNEWTASAQIFPFLDVLAQNEETRNTLHTTTAPDRGETRRDKNCGTTLPPIYNTEKPYLRSLFSQIRMEQAATSNSHCQFPDTNGGWEIMPVWFSKELPFLHCVLKPPPTTRAFFHRFLSANMRFLPNITVLRARTVFN